MFDYKKEYIGRLGFIEMKEYNYYQSLNVYKVIDAEIQKGKDNITLTLQRALEGGVLATRLLSIKDFIFLN